MDIPGGLQVLSAQVAGHTWTDVKALGLLQDAAKGFVYKPLIKPDCGEREMCFYITIQYDNILTNDYGGDNDDIDDEHNEDSGPTTTRPSITTTKRKTSLENNLLLKTAQNFVPRFYGEVKLNVNGRIHSFLQLQDLTYGMRQPCVMDIKIGRQTWDPMADEHKRSVEEQKYVGCKQTLGLCIPGFQVYHRNQTREKSETKAKQDDDCRLFRYGKDYGKRLLARDFPETMRIFMNAHDSSMCVSSLMHELLVQLHAIHDWFQMQTMYHFYASSLLLIYDFEMLLKWSEQCTHDKHVSLKESSNSHSPGMANGHAVYRNQDHRYNHQFAQPKGAIDSDNSLSPSFSDWAKVKMIDFAHVFPANDNSTDENYLFGLRNLIDVLEAIPVCEAARHKQY